MAVGHLSRGAWCVLPHRFPPLSFTVVAIIGHHQYKFVFASEMAAPELLAKGVHPSEPPYIRIFVAHRLFSFSFLFAVGAVLVQFAVRRLFVVGEPLITGVLHLSLNRCAVLVRCMLRFFGLSSVLFIEKLHFSSHSRW